VSRGKEEEEEEVVVVAGETARSGVDSAVGQVQSSLFVSHFPPFQELLLCVHFIKEKLWMKIMVMYIF
jgi:hypothetical protein